MQVETMKIELDGKSIEKQGFVSNGFGAVTILRKTAQGKKTVTTNGYVTTLRRSTTFIQMKVGDTWKNIMSIEGQVQVFTNTIRNRKDMITSLNTTRRYKNAAGNNVEIENVRLDKDIELVAKLSLENEVANNINTTYNIGFDKFADALEAVAEELESIPLATTSANKPMEQIKKDNESLLNQSM